jgi:glycosyltransferase involved in cell wall biosynthesis|tara:strand:+ start:49 stop:1185 length:1137 start_codon:yes stop_codon:yes gene_type:complete
MFKLCIEGWRNINHSFAIVNQRQLLEFVKLPIHLRHLDVTFFNKNWNSQKNANGFTPEENLIISSIQSPSSKENFDVVYRITYPYNLDTSLAKKTFFFGTTEFEHNNKNFINGALDKVSKRDDLFVVAPSQWSKEGFIKAGFKDSQIKLINLGVDTKVFFPINQEERKDVRKQLNIKNDDFVLLSIGAMTENKGIKLLLIAFAILRQNNKKIKLILKDQSNLYEIFAQSHIKALKDSKFKKLINDELISNIILLSKNLNYQEINDLYGASDCYVSPYLAEGFGLTPLEAAATGTPIVVTKGGSTDDYFDPIMGNQISSRLIESEKKTFYIPDVESLVECISSVIKKPENYGGLASHNFISSNLSMKKSVDKLLKKMSE